MCTASDPRPALPPRCPRDDMQRVVPTPLLPSPVSLNSLHGAAGDAFLNLIKITLNNAFAGMNADAAMRTLSSLYGLCLELPSKFV